MTQRTPFDQTEPTPDEVEGIAAFTDRRTVLTAGVVVVGAGALAACSSPPVVAETQSSSSSAAPSSSPAATGTSEPDDDDDGVATPAPGGTPTSDIPVGAGKIYPDQQLVVTQPAAGQFKAFSAICTHQGCTVGRIEGGEIICPCHSSHFDISTGAPTPDSLAQSPLPAKTITVTGDSFVVS